MIEKMLTVFRWSGIQMNWALTRKILFAGILVGIGLLFTEVSNFSSNACNYIQNRVGELVALRGD